MAAYSYYIMITMGMQLQSEDLLNILTQKFGLCILYVGNLLLREIVDKKDLQQLKMQKARLIKLSTTSN